jgi:hypothetical protein
LHARTQTEESAQPLVLVGQLEDLNRADRGGVGSELGRVTGIDCATRAFGTSLHRGEGRGYGSPQCTCDRVGARLR